MDKLPLLLCRNLDSGYGKKQVLYNVSIEVFPREIVALIGPNGAGKSTILKTIHGLVPTWEGQVVYLGRNISGASPLINVKNGITYAPQGNRVFSDLSIEENLQMGGIFLPKRQLDIRIKEILPLFPELRKNRKRKAGALSGGEQQMVAIARSLVSEPRLLLLDEPSIGLSPKLVKDVFEKVQVIREKTGIGILIVEQKVNDILQICDRVYSMKLGRIVFNGEPAELINDKNRLKELFLWKE